MNKRIVFVLVAVILAAFGWYAYSNQYNEGELYSSFMEGCNEGEAQPSFCSCVWKELRGDYTLAELESYADNSDADIEAFVTPYVLDCIYLYE